MGSRVPAQVRGGGAARGQQHLRTTPWHAGGNLLLQYWLPACQAGIDDGAVLLTGGRRPPSCPKGYFLEPTVFIKVSPGMRIWKEEIFGPILSGDWGVGG